jgi:uncharacterized membrane protein YeaQ/YmgE (transglycosylase-associated protein family)
MTFSVIIAWLAIGFVIGGLARLLVPRRQPIGVFRTLLAGMSAHGRSAAGSPASSR